MSTAVTATLGSDIDLSEPGAALPAPGLSNPGLSSLAPLHRLAEARRQEGISRRTVARHLKISIGQVRAGTGGPRSSLSTLYAWQRVLNVPITELLEESDTALSVPVMTRAQLLRMMKTVVTILERCKQKSIRRMAQFLSEQLVEVMPELKEIAPWPAVGKAPHVARSRPGCPSTTDIRPLRRFRF